MVDIPKFVTAYNIAVHSAASMGPSKVTYSHME